jgi:hypothetical protein
VVIVIENSSTLSRFRPRNSITKSPSDEFTRQETQPEWIVSTGEVINLLTANACPYHPHPDAISLESPCNFSSVRELRYRAGDAPRVGGCCGSETPKHVGDGGSLRRKRPWLACSLHRAEYADAGSAGPAPALLYPMTPMRRRRAAIDPARPCPAGSAEGNEPSSPWSCTPRLAGIVVFS